MKYLFFNSRFEERFLINLIIFCWQEQFHPLIFFSRKMNYILFCWFLVWYPLVKISSIKTWSLHHTSKVNELLYVQCVHDERNKSIQNQVSIECWNPRKHILVWYLGISFKELCTQDVFLQSYAFVISFFECNTLFSILI